MSNADKSALFIYAWRALAPEAAQDAIEWIPEYKFNLPATKHRFDWALPDLKIACECDGGQWVANGGRHNTDSDRTKMNIAAALGWRVFRFSTTQLETDPAACIALVLRGLGIKVTE